VLGHLVVKDGNSTAVVISRNDAYANPMRDEVVNAIRESGGTVLDTFHYDQTASDFTKYVQRIKAENPQAIVLLGFKETARILSEMIKQGIGPQSKKVKVYLDSASLSNTLASQVDPQRPGVLAGVKGTLPPNGGEDFAKRLRQISGGLRDVTYAAQSYDSVVITVLAAAIAHTDEPDLVAKEINGVTEGGRKCTSFAECIAHVKVGEDIDYDGLSGPLEFTDPGEPPTATYVINEIQPDGTVEPAQ
jgi:branched-chain amino acid transport system substrate-binding protein